MPYRPSTTRKDGLPSTRTASLTIRPALGIEALSRARGNEMPTRGLNPPQRCEEQAATLVKQWQPARTATKLTNVGSRDLMEVTLAAIRHISRIGTAMDEDAL